MSGRPSTYEFDAGRGAAWVVAHAPEHAEAFARAQGWSAGGRKRFGALGTMLLCECDIDAMLDAQGAPVGANP